MLQFVIKYITNVTKNIGFNVKAPYIALFSFHYRDQNGSLVIHFLDKKLITSGIGITSNAKVSFNLHRKLRWRVLPSPPL